MQELGLMASNSLHFLTMNISIAFSQNAQSRSQKTFYEAINFDELVKEETDV